MPFRDLPEVITCQFKPGDYLFRRGNPMPYVFYLKKGVVKRETITQYGEVIIHHTKESDQLTGSIVGLLYIFSKNFDGICTDDFIAVTDCICYRIPSAVCKKYILSHSDLTEELIEMVIELFDETEVYLDNKKALTATQYTCEFLSLHSEKIGNNRILPKKYTNVELSKYLGIHSVTVSRIINVLRKEGVIERTPEGLLIKNMKALQEYITGAKTMSYQYKRRTNSI